MTDSLKSHIELARLTQSGPSLCCDSEYGERTLTLTHFCRRWTSDCSGLTHAPAAAKFAAKGGSLMRIITTAAVAASLWVSAFAGAAASPDGDQCSQRQDRDASIAACTRIIDSGAEKGHNLGMAFYQRGNAYRAKGDNDRAILDYNQALSADPNNVSVYNNRAVAYFNKGDYDSAIADYNHAIAIDPKHLYAYIGRSESYGQKKDYGQAIADLNKAIELDPKNAGAFNGRCWYNAVMGQHEAALADCNRSLALQPSDATLDSRGFVYLKLGQLDNAIADYNAALKANPKLATSLYGRGVAETKKGNADAGNADIAAATAIQADIAARMASLGITLSWSAIVHNSNDL